MNYYDLISSKSGLLFKDFEKEVDEKTNKLFVIHNKNGVEATITNFGSRLVSLSVPDKKGEYRDVVLGHKTIKEYIEPENEFYFGAIIGRYANRIANGIFSIGKQKFALEKNNGNNHLHGGNNGFHKVIWEARQLSENEIEFSHFSEDMKNGYPGNLRVVVNYKLHEKNELEICYKATSDKETIVNLTSHPYFNLAGEGANLDQHLFMINADFFTPITNDQIPSGEQKSVKNTPFDFRKQKYITTDFQSNDPQIQYGNGFDHNFVLNAKPSNNEGLVLAASVKEQLIF